MDSIVKEGVMGISLEDSRCSCSTFARGESIKSGGNPQTTVENIPNVAPKRQENRRHHCRFHPKHAPKSDNYKTKPYLIEESIRRANEVYRESLKYPIGKASYHETKHRKDGSYRKRRSQIRELLYCPVIEALLHHLNLKTGFVGIFNYGKLKTFSPAEISKKAFVPYEQVLRVLHILENYHYVELIQEIYTNHAGQKRRRPTKIKINIQYFRDLDFTDKELEIITGKEIKKENKLIVAYKDKEYREVQKSTKAKAKQELNKIRKSLSQLIIDARSGKQLTDEEKDLLNQEQPGWDNKRESTSMYADFTGIAHNREEVLAKNGIKQGSDIQQYHMKHILAFLKPPPS